MGATKGDLLHLVDCGIEAVLLGTVLRTGDFAFQEISFLNVEDFGLEKHRLIFQIIRDLAPEASFSSPPRNAMRESTMISGFGSQERTQSSTSRESGNGISPFQPPYQRSNVLSLTPKRLMRSRATGRGFSRSNINTGMPCAIASLTQAVANVLFPQPESPVSPTIALSGSSGSRI